MYYVARQEAFLEPPMSSRVGRERRLDPIDLILRRCTTRREHDVLLLAPRARPQGVRGTRRAQIFFYVPYEPQASIGKTHGRHSLAPAARTFSHFLSLTLMAFYFYAELW